MKMSHMFGLTLRQVPADAETASHQLLVRAGFIPARGWHLLAHANGQARDR